jgi:hypothetical protein
MPHRLLPEKLQADMSKDSKHNPNTLLTIVGLLIGLLLMSWLVDGLRDSDGIGGLGSARAQERREALVELRETNAAQLSSYGVVNEANEIYHIPIGRAMEMIVADWQNPEEGRRLMLARSEKAFVAPATAPVAAPPSIYE